MDDIQRNVRATLRLPDERDSTWKVVKRRPYDTDKEEVPCVQPGHHEYHEGKIAFCLVPEVSKHLRDLSSERQTVPTVICCSRDTHGEDEVTTVHDEHDGAAYTREVVRVAEGNEGDGHDVVCHHLPVVLSARLRVEDEYLVQIICSLKKIIELDGPGKGYIGITYPDVYRV